MKQIKKITWVLLLTAFLISTEGVSQVVYDIDGNEYGTTTIGNQVWMSGNLITTTYSDGTSIPLYLNADNATWSTLTAGGRASYRDSTSFGNAYGYLYNWYAVNDSKGLCPTGWRIPTIGEFNDLLLNAGMASSDTSTTGKITESNKTAGRLKGTADSGSPHWQSNTDATDEYGFSWYGGGVKYVSGVWGPDDYYRQWGALWSRSLDTSTKAWRIIALNSDGYIRKNSGNLNLGTAARCVTDATVQLDNSEGFRMLTSPVDTNYAMFLDQIWTQGMSNADTDQGDANVWTWDTGTGSWTAVSDLNTELTAGTAVLVYVFNDRDYDGNANTSGSSLYIGGSLDTDDVTPSINSTINGYTLLGNPYNKEIDFDNVATTNLASTIYIWDPTANSGSGEWEEWNGSSGDISGGVIPAFQGFFVQTSASSPSLTFDYSNDTTATTGSYYGKINTELPNNIRLLLKGESMASSLWLQFDEQGSINEVLGTDARKLKSLNVEYVQLATSKGDELLSIAHLPEVSDDFTIPIAIDVTKGGNFKLSATDFNIPDDLILIFNDHSKNVSTVIDNKFNYELNLSATKQKQTIESPLELAEGRSVIKAVATVLDDYSITVQRTTSVNNEEDFGVPSRLNLSQNYPNPFNPSTQISFDLPVQSQVRLAVYDMLGREVSVLVNEVRSAGNYQVTFDASGLSSGMYIYRLEAIGQIFTQRMTLIK